MTKDDHPGCDVACCSAAWAVEYKPRVGKANRLCALHAGERIELLERRDSEAATYIESVICMRTKFTGSPPCVGWKGLGLALTEALDERDELRRVVSRAKAAAARGR